ncbi:MAG: DJ-1/PfpI family protein [Bacilli bacterium]
MKILVVVTDGYEELEAIGTVAMLRRAKLDVDFCAIDNTEATGRYGVTSKELINLKTVNIDSYDMLVIPGGPEYVLEEKNQDFLAMVMSFFTHDKYIAAICAGPTILGHLGILKGKKYTCFTSMDEDFGGTYVDQYTVRDGKIITGRSCAATVDFSLNIIETLMGKNYAQDVKDSIYYNRG